MNKLLVLTIITAAVSLYAISSFTSTAAGVEDQFYSFMAEHKKSYTSEVELGFRMELFKESMKKAEQLNIKHPKARFGATQFSDITDEEYSQYLGKSQVSDNESEIVTLEEPATFSNVDFRHVMQAVQSQGKCGSCWAFASAAVMEGRLCWDKGLCEKLSEQQYVDCVTECSGCGGGDEIESYKYLKNQPSCFYDSYPYEGIQKECRDSTCHQGPKSLGGNKVVGEAQIYAALQNGPVSIGLNFDEWPKHYQGGVVTNSMCVSTNINHAITVVGYQEDKDGSYWIVRNSYGAAWGESGHFRLQYGTGVCEMGKDCAFAIV